MVSDGSRAGGVCRTPGRECLFWPMPPYYSYYLLYSTSIEDSRCWLRTIWYSKNTRTTREACEASTNSSTIVDWTHPITCCNACTIMYSENIFCLVPAPTQRSDSKAIHKFSKFITGISFYYRQQVINPQRQRGYIINTKVFITQQITSNEMNFNSTIPRCWKRLL